MRTDINMTVNGAAILDVMRLIVETIAEHSAIYVRNYTKWLATCDIEERASSMLSDSGCERGRVGKLSAADELYPESLLAYENDEWVLQMSVNYWTSVVPKVAQKPMFQLLQCRRKRVRLPPAAVARVFDLPAKSQQRRVIEVPLRRYCAFTNSDLLHKLDAFLQA